MSSEEAKIINNTITRLLAMREHSVAEILQKLSAKGYELHRCENQLQLFIDNNIQSDQRYLESYIRSAYLKGKGPQVIVQALKQHNIEGADVSEQIKSDEYDWFELAGKVREKRFGSEQPLDFADKQKQKRFLQYRGFEHEHINEAFD